MLKWKSLSLTHVEYLKEDTVGLFLAFSSLLPFCLIVGFVTLILFRRDLHTIFFFIGAVLSEISNLLIKNVIAEPRPLTRGEYYTEYGMPSSHAQLSWFFVCYCTLFILLRLKRNPECPLETLWKTITITGLISTATLVSYSRIHLLYHYPSQVFYGALVGNLFGSIWFFIVNNLLTPHFPTIASWEICEFLLIRDSSYIPNILWFEYTNARNENKNRLRKLHSMKSQ